MGQITKLEIGVNGEFLDISDRIKYIHLGNSGFGLPNFERFTEQGPLQNSVTDLGFRLSARQLSLVLMLLGSNADPSTYFARRDELLYYFTPRTTPLVLRFTYPDGTIRQLDCHTSGGLEFDSGDKLSYAAHKIGVNLVAPDPLFYNPETVALSLGIEVSSYQFAIPWEFPWNIGSSTLDTSVNVEYAGTFESNPIITIVGPVTDLVITNETTGDKLDFTGSTISGGDTYTADLRYGFKTLKDQTGTSQLSKLTSDSDLSTFALVPRPEAPDGINTITVTGSSADSNTEIYISYTEKYIGI